MLYAIGGFTSSYPDMPFSYPYGPTNTPYTTNEQYTPFGYGTVPPKTTVVSPLISNYTLGNVSLAFTVNKPTVWMGYSLDGQDNVTIAGNITLTSLAVGLHNVTVYAKDEFENIAASDTVTFSIAETPEPFPTTLVAATILATVALVGVGLLVYFKKRKQ